MAAIVDRARLSIVVTAFTLLAMPTIASAHAGNSDPNVLHVCIGNVSKVVRSVGIAGSCIAGPPVVAETADHWARQGVPGPNGTDGTSVTFVDYFSGNQTGCPNGGAIYAAGNPPVNTFVCNGTNGQDGEDGTTAARADGPCFDNDNRYVDCGNGTVTDTVTGLIWLQQAQCLPDSDWAAANQAAAGLSDGDCGLTDGSLAGDWRLPTKDEWSATIARADALGCQIITVPSAPPSLTNDAGTACLSVGPSPFPGVPSDFFGSYWSSTSDETIPTRALFANLIVGRVAVNNKTEIRPVWPVRGGPR
jgi:predicted outer membrane repeat protein